MTTPTAFVRCISRRGTAGVLALAAALCGGVATAAPTANGRIVYGVGSTTPQHRAYTAGTPGTFGAQTAAVAGATPSFTVARAAPTRNERIAAYVTTGGQLYVIRWNGTAWSNEWNVAVGGDGVNGRRFDVAYEDVTGDAVVVYSNNTSGSNELRYRVWNGSTWTLATSLDSARLAQIPAWIKLLPRPGSDEIALTVADRGSTTANRAALTTLVWSGSAWGNEPGSAHSTSVYSTGSTSPAQSIQNELFDMAWEASTGYLMVVWTQASTAGQYYRRWSGATRAWGSPTSFGGTARVPPLQMFAAGDPGSANIVAGWNQSGSASVYSTVWTGSAWSSVTTLGTNGTTPAVDKRSVTARWLATGGVSYPVVVWGASTAGTVGYRRATVSGTTVTWATAATQAFTNGGSWGAWAWMDSAVDPRSGDTLALTFSDANSDLYARQLVLSAGPTLAWTSETSAALTTSLTNATTQNFAFAYDRYLGSITLADGTAPANATICVAPAVATYLDHFTLLASSATNVTSITTTFNADPAGLLGLLEVTDDAGVSQGSLASPSGLNPAVTGMSFAAPTSSAAQYRLRVTPSATATSSATFTATVTGVANSGGLGLTGTDSTSASIVVDGAASPDVTGATAAASVGAVTANWTNPAAGTVPASDFGGYVVVLGNTVAITGAPSKGTASYAVGTPVGADSVICAGSVTTCTQSGLAPSQAYYLKIFTRDGCANWSAGVQATATTPNLVTMLGDGTNPGAASLAPGGAETALDAFTLQTGTGTDTVTAATVTLAAGTYVGLSQVRIVGAPGCAGGTQYGAAVPAADAVAFTGMAIPVTTTLASFYVCVTPRAHADMPAPPGAVYAVTGTVTAFSSANPQLGADAASATVTIDNASSPDVSAAGATGGASTVTATWTNPPAGVAPATDFGGYVVVLGNTSPVTGRPAEGTGTYAAGGAIGADTIVCAGGVTTCQKTGLSIPQTYYMKIFTRDAVNNWSVGVQVSATTGDARTSSMTLAGTSPSCSQVNLSAAYAGDTNGNNTVTFARGAAAGGPFADLTGCVALGGATDPRTCGDSTVAASTTYYYQATFTDPDGYLGSNVVASGPVAVGACPPNLLLTNPGTQPAGSTLTVGAAAWTYVGQLALATDRGTVTVGSIAVVNGAAAPQAAGGDLQLNLVSSAGTGVYSTGRWDGTRWVFDAISDPTTGLPVAIGTSPTTFRVYATAGYGAAASENLAARFDPASVVGLAPFGTTTGTAFTANTFTTSVPGTVDEGSTTSTTAPMVSIVNPDRGKVVSGDFLVQIYVYSPAAAAISAVGLSTDGTAPACSANDATIAPEIARTYAQAGAAMYSKVVRGLAAGTYTFKACARNAAGALVSQPVTVTVRAAGTGDGSLLVRDNASQLCSDCHDQNKIKTHSSESTRSAKGTWSTTCRDCHTPHGTRNLYLVKEQIVPPAAGGAYQAVKDVRIATTVGDSNVSGVTSPAQSSFVNTDNSGPCQVCHTRTVNPGNTLQRRWQNTGNDDTHYTAAGGTQPCTDCHQHQSGFAAGEPVGGGATCSGCHSTLFKGMNGTVAKVSKHGLGSASPTDTAATWGNPLSTSVAVANRSCVGMCHGDHPHDLPGTSTTHEYNAYLDAATQASRANGTRTTATRAATDFDGAATNGGMCVSCHQNPITSAANAITVQKTAYGASAHNYTTFSTYGAWTYTQHDGGAFRRNCTKCHADRADSRPGDATTPFGAVHYSDYPDLLAGVKNPATTNGTVDATRRATFACYNCHGNGTTGANLSGKDIASLIAHEQTAGQSGHPSDKDAVHDSVTEYANAAFGNALGGAARHASCMDCHDPHQAQAGPHAAQTNQAGPSLQGAWGAQLSTLPTRWAAPTSASFTRKTIVAGTDAEATLCFKCHSAYYGTLPTAPSSGSPGFAETDQAREFNPNNASSGATAGSFHPVLASAGNNLGATSNVASPWTRTSLMTCSDCHASDTTTDPAGPHGSAAGFLLRGPNTTWNATIATGSAGMPGGTFCINCHSASFTNSRFPAHVTRSNHFVACWNCHAAIPHGTARPGLLVAVDQAPYGDKTTDVAPYRQMPNATSSGLYIVSYPTSNTASWSQNNCGCGSTGGH